MRFEPIHPETHELASGVYDFIENINPTNLFYYSSVAVLCLFTFQFIPPITISHLTALFISFLIMLYWDKKDKREHKTRMEDLYFKLHMINPRPKWFYIDSDIIELVDDIKEYREYNVVSFTQMIYALDNFLEIVHDMELGVKDFEDNIEVAKHQKRKAIDNLQSILFKLPVDRALEYKLERAIYHLRLMLQRHIDSMIHKQQEHIKEHGYDKNTKVFYFDHPEGLDNEPNRQYLNYS